MRHYIPKRLEKCNQLMSYPTIISWRSTLSAAKKRTIHQWPDESTHKESFSGFGNRCYIQRAWTINYHYPDLGISHNEKSGKKEKNYQWKSADYQHKSDDRDNLKGNGCRREGLPVLNFSQPTTNSLKLVDSYLCCCLWAHRSLRWWQ